MSTEHTHRPAGGVGWVVLDAIVCASAAVLVGLFAEWLIRQRRAERARAALRDMDQPGGGPVADPEALRQEAVRKHSRGQAQPDPGSA